MESSAPTGSALYPYVWVRIGCQLCSRTGRYRLARLAAKFGAEILIDDLLEELARDCPWRRPRGARPPGKYEAKCGAYLPDIDSRV